MDGLRNCLVVASFVCAALIVSGRDVKAQGTPVAGYPATTSPLNGGGMGMGMGILPMMYAMNPSASLSPTDAAALGTQGQGTGSLGANGMNSMFRNPMAAPLLYSSMLPMSPNQAGSTYPMSPQQAGALMLATQAGMLGIGSGQLSGVRPGNAQSRTRPGQQPAAKSRGTASQPGGLATRYFNRTATVNRFPQSYYKRENHYYPQVAR